MALEEFQYAECLSITRPLRSFCKLPSGLLVLIAGLGGIRLPGFGGCVARMSVRLESVSEEVRSVKGHHGGLTNVKGAVSIATTDTS